MIYHPQQKSYTSYLTKENLKIEDKQNIYNKWADSYNIYVKNQYYSGPITFIKNRFRIYENFKKKLVIYPIINPAKFKCSRFWMWNWSSW